MIDYIASLNDPQREAVTHGEGPLMIIAGAGSGKTRVLTYRIAYLIERRVDPFRILALTFTNKAAGEMRNRIEKVIGSEARNIWMGTFHSVFAKILRIEARAIGYTSNFSIYDTDDSKSLLRSIIKEMGLDDKVYRANSVFSRISGAKNRLIGPEDYLINPVIKADDESARIPETGRIYKEYARRCFAANAMDFDDLLFNTNVLFRDHLDILHKYQHKFQYVLVDEFQDTNVSQYLITRKLAAVHQNICVVGDDAQSIYAFRGANIENILNFQRDYGKDSVKIVKLEQNYRSTKHIVEAANSVIARNRNQLEKRVFTDNGDGSLIDVIKAASDNEEGRLVAQAIFEAKMQEGLKNNDFAILYRTNAQSRAFEEALRKLSIKYRIIGGLSFYQRKEIKDLIAYLRFSVNQQDEEAFKRIINLPKRGIGDTTVAKISVLASEREVPVWEIVSNINQYIAGRASLAIEAFSDLIKSFGLLLDKKDAYEVSAHIAKASGLLKDLYEDKTVEGLARYENVQELLNAIKEFVDNPDNEDKSLSSFLQTVSLMTTADEKEDDGDNDKVTLMTIHGAKGLEFKNVHIVGLEEELFPSQMMLESRADLEEERRLFYVAITRAERRLTMSYAETRYHYGRLKMCEPSRFLMEVDQSHLKMARTALERNPYGTKQDAREGKAIPDRDRNEMPSAGSMSFVRSLAQKTARNQAPQPTVSHTPSADFTPSDTSTLAAGMKVEHAKFGFGTVKSLDINGTNRKAVIQFDTAGEKTLLLSFAKLRIVA